MVKYTGRNGQEYVLRFDMAAMEEMKEIFAGGYTEAMQKMSGGEMGQVKEIFRILAKSGEQVTACVSIMIPDTLIHERIAHRAHIEGRADDARPEVVENRIKTYHDKTEPLIAFYKKAGKYSEIDGVGTIEQVRERIFSAMDKF